MGTDLEEAKGCPRDRRPCEDRNLRCFAPSEEGAVACNTSILQAHFLFAAQATAADSERRRPTTVQGGLSDMELRTSAHVHDPSIGSKFVVAKLVGHNSQAMFATAQGGLPDSLPP